MASNTRTPRVLDDLSALRARLEAAEAMVETLKAQNSKETRVTLEDYKGTPVLKFEGNFKPFHAGLSKCKAHLEMADTIKKFIKSNGKSID